MEKAKIIAFLNKVQIICEAISDACGTNHNRSGGPMFRGGNFFGEEFRGENYARRKGKDTSYHPLSWNRERVEEATGLSDDDLDEVEEFHERLRGKSDEEIREILDEEDGVTAEEVNKVLRDRGLI
jgi:hypothetical protein